MIRAKKSQQTLLLGAQPRVELLPPEVKLRERARSMRRASVGVLALVVLLVGTGYGTATYRSAQAATELSVAQARTAQLQVERQKYAPVTTTSAAISDIGRARTLAASTEILWSNLMDSILATLPPGVTITSATMKGQAPWEAALVPSGPLREPHIATISIVVASPTIFDAAAVSRSLASVPGFADATPDSLVGSPTGYSTTITLNINDKALSGRFAIKGASK